MSLRSLLPQALLAGLAGMLFSLLVYGYSGSDNPQHYQFRPVLEALQAPGRYARDPYVQASKGLPSVFWRSLAALFQDDEASDRGFFLLYLAAAWALFAAVFGLGAVLGGSPAAAWAACGLAALSGHLHLPSLLAHDLLFRDRFDQTFCAWPLLISAFSLWLAERRPAAWALLGLAFDLNPFLSASLALCLFAAERVERRPLREAAEAAGLFFLLGLPESVLALRGPGTSLPSAEWAGLLRLWFPFHYFPSSWSAGQWLYVGAHGGVFLALAAAAWPRGPLSARLKAFGLCLGFYWLVYGLSAELAPWRPLILLQAYRLDVLAVLIGLTGGAVLIGRLAARGEAAWAALLWIVLSGAQRTLLPLALLLPIALYWALRGEEPGALPRPLRVYLAALGLASLARFGLGVGPSGLYPLQAAGAVVALSVLILNERRGLAPAVLAGLLALGAFAEGVHAWRSERASSAAEPAKRARRSVEAWLRQHTPQEALVLAFPLYPDLRLGSRRSQVAEEVDGAVLHWNPGAAPAWKERMDDLGWDFGRMDELGRALARERFPLLSRGRARVRMAEPWSEERTALLLSKYRPDYVVSPLPLRAPGLEPAAQVEGGLIYRLNNKEVR